MSRQTLPDRLPVASMERNSGLELYLVSGFARKYHFDRAVNLLPKKKVKSDLAATGIQLWN